MGRRKEEMMGTARLEAELKELRRDNDDLKRYILALQGEVYGARLAAKYLDKELAGRWVQLSLSHSLFQLQNAYFVALSLPLL